MGHKKEKVDVLTEWDYTYKMESNYHISNVLSVMCGTKAYKQMKEGRVVILY